VLRPRLKDEDLKLTTDLHVVSRLIMRRASYPGSYPRMHEVAFNELKVCY